MADMMIIQGIFILEGTTEWEGGKKDYHVIIIYFDVFKVLNLLFPSCGLKIRQI